ncbi:hypothetical protein GCM10025862_37580 [Arsenicicoccus piscis]|uniref:Uncharacterized protein n=1 Tax=Arsenicicoccus piscis TaxID=673954 RepID=A0ABQ6HHB2_9MICO|nr:hypothetical protein GCM10025862_00450 [Arsenicicoccus piscis]GMA21737.1 hypothetical protein GCM10025862_37580 [Arsenicicoccus piscis]
MDGNLDDAVRDLTDEPCVGDQDGLVAIADETPRQRPERDRVAAAADRDQDYPHTRRRFQVPDPGISHRRLTAMGILTLFHISGPETS